MIARATAWLCVMATALPLAAQTTMPEGTAVSTQPTAFAPSVWAGELTGANVYVRYGPGEQAYPCTKLSTPERVIVVGKADGWLRIVAPKGCFSVISKEFVQLDETGRVGTVTGDNVWVRAGGDLRTSDFVGVQRQLNRGHTVQVLGELEDYYRIVPPEGAYFYISERYVRPVGAASTTPSGEREVEPARTQPAIVEVVPPRSVPSAGPTQSEKLAAFKAAEKVLAEEFTKPLEKRDLKKVEAMYDAIPLAAGDPLKLYVDARVAFVRQTLRDMADLERVKELAKTTAEKQAEYEALRERLQKVTPPPQLKRLPAATGVLQTSAVFPGTAAIARRYILIDPNSGNVAAYIQSMTDQVDLSKYVDRTVAVFGTTKFDVTLQRAVVEADEIQVLGPGGTLPSAPEPVIRAPQPSSQPSEAPAGPAMGPPAEPAVKPPVKPAVEPVAEPVKPVEPVAAPSVKPAVEPVVKPAPRPVEPVAAPSVKPAVEPAVKPAPRPVEPAVAPSVKPVVEPPPAPTTKPVVEPAVGPTTKPAVEPAVEPATMPSVRPAVAPTTQPTVRRVEIGPIARPPGTPTSRPGARPAATTQPASTTAPAEGLPVVTEKTPADTVSDEEYE